MPTTTNEKYKWIDSSVDADTGWDTFGGREAGDLPMLQEGVGALGALHGDPQAFHLFPNIDQRQMIEEMEANPTFGKKLTAMLHDRNAVGLVMASAKRAILNEMYPKQYPESKGEWATLRKRFNILVRDIPGAIDKQIKSMTPQQKMAVVKAIAQGGGVSLQLGATAPATPAPAAGGDMWGSIIGSIAQAAGSIYAAKITTDAQKDVAKLQAQTAAQTTAMQQQMAQNQALIEAAKAAAVGGGATVGQVMASSVGGSGVPMWAIPVGLGVLGLVLYFVFKGRG